MMVYPRKAAPDGKQTGTYVLLAPALYSQSPQEIRYHRPNPRRPFVATFITRRMPLRVPCAPAINSNVSPRLTGQSERAVSDGQRLLETRPQLNSAQRASQKQRVGPVQGTLEHSGVFRSIGGAAPVQTRRPSKGAVQKAGPPEERLSCHGPHRRVRNLSGKVQPCFGTEGLVTPIPRTNALRSL